MANAYDRLLDAERLMRTATRDLALEAVRDAIQALREARDGSVHQVNHSPPPREQVLGRMGDMAPPPNMTLDVIIQNDGDAIVTVRSLGTGASCEFCSRAGGGRSPETVRALHALAAAIVRDNAATPELAWPPMRHAAGKETEVPNGSR